MTSVFCMGVFDELTPDELSFLAKARSLGSELVAILFDEGATRDAVDRENALYATGLVSRVYAMPEGLDASWRRIASLGPDAFAFKKDNDDSRYERIRFHFARRGVDNVEYHSISQGSDADADGGN